MDKKELTPTATSNSPSSSTTNKLKKPSSSSTTTTDTDSSGSTATTPSGNAMLPQRVLQNFLLIWLDSSLDKSKHDFKKSIQQLRCLVASIVVFTDTRQCINFLNEIKNEKVFMILSGSQGRRLKPRTYALSQLDSVYIFCHNQATHEEWANKISKIKGIYTRIKPIFKALQIDCERCDQAMISISFRGIDPLFMYTQLFKEVFFEIRDDDEKSIKEFVEYCRIHDDIPEDQIKKIERKYHRYSTIWWYTAPYFIYSMLNRGLRLLDVNIILKMGFFIRHLHRDIEELHREQQSITTTATNPFQVYRGQGLSVQDFEKMKQTKGGLMSFNNFLLTSRNRRISLKRFARPAALNPNSVGILFVMTIDPILCARSSTPFVDIKNVGYHKDQEEEILFSIHTIFRIDKIKRIEDKHTRRLWEVHLTLTGNDDNDLNKVAARIHEETSWTTGWPKLGHIFIKVGESVKAEQLYQILLEKATSDKDRADYNSLLGLFYDNMGEYSKALSSHEKALDINQKSLPSNHPDLASSYDNIGGVYFKMSKYSEALSSHQKALDIRQKTLPPNHPDLISSYNNIGFVYKKMGDYSKALPSYKKALDIRRKSLPSNHLDLASSYGSIGLVYEKLCKYSKALSFYEKACKILEKSLPPTHPHIAQLRRNIQRVKPKCN